eukprot:gene9431-11170_t
MAVDSDDIPAANLPDKLPVPVNQSMEQPPEAQPEVRADIRTLPQHGNVLNNETNIDLIDLSGDAIPPRRTTESIRNGSLPVGALTSEELEPSSTQATDTAHQPELTESVCVEDGLASQSRKEALGGQPVIFPQLSELEEQQKSATAQELSEPNQDVESDFSDYASSFETIGSAQLELDDSGRPERLVGEPEAVNAESSGRRRPALDGEWKHYRRGVEWRCRWLELRMQWDLQAVTADELSSSDSEVSTLALYEQMEELQRRYSFLLNVQGFLTYQPPSLTLCNSSGRKRDKHEDDQFNINNIVTPVNMGHSAAFVSGSGNNSWDGLCVFCKVQARGDGVGVLLEVEKVEVVGVLLEVVLEL